MSRLAREDSVTTDRQVNKSNLWNKLESIILKRNIKIHTGDKGKNKTNTMQVQCFCVFKLGVHGSHGINESSHNFIAIPIVVKGFLQKTSLFSLTRERFYKYF